MFSQIIIAEPYISLDNMLSAMFSASQELADLILTTTVWGEGCYIPILYMKKLRHTVYKW